MSDDSSLERTDNSSFHSFQYMFIPGESEDIIINRPIEIHHFSFLLREFPPPNIVPLGSSF